MNAPIIIGGAMLHHADCRDVLRALPDNSIDSVVTDPPYALVSIVKRFGKPGSAPVKDGDVYARASAGFMGKSWDTGEVAFATEFWAEVLRVLKPGGHVVAFSGTRTYHRMVVAIEDAGFEIRDQLGWLYGSGFPKSHNLDGDWLGWGTALKPAWEPIVLARKVIIGTVAKNVLEHGTGGLNVDGCRVGDEVRVNAPGSTKDRVAMGGGWREDAQPTIAVGRWPANIVHDGSDEVLAAFPDAPGQQGDLDGQSEGRTSSGIYGDMPAARQALARVDDSSSAARFFYCAKASRRDRDEGLTGFAKAPTSDGRAVAADNAYQRGKTMRANTHPTVKPAALMQWLCRLVTPPGGVILDPFTGSGSTGKAALLEGFRFIGCEREDEYLPIAAARIGWALGQRDAADDAVPVPANDNVPVATTQADLFGVAA